MDDLDFPEYRADTEMRQLPELLQAANNSIMEPRAAMNLVVECKDLMMLYACAMKEMRTKFENLNTEYGVRSSRNPIRSISTRLKGSASIVDKLQRKGLSFSPQNIEQHIHDVAGIRVICYYVDDIFALAEAISHQQEVKLLELKDYITYPKPNGYRSLHMILSVPVFLSEQTRWMKVEVQIRTIAMDFWASLEHQLKYKHQIAGEREIVAQLKECANTIAATDAKMMDLRNQIESGIEQSEDELLLEKLKKMDHPLE